MLSQAKPPLDATMDRNYKNQFEQFALCYLAYYASEPLQPRVLLSFQRAFGMDDIQMHPRVADGHNGYLITRTITQGDPRVTVAFSGISDVNQVRPWVSTRASMAANYYEGLAYSPFVQIAQAVSDAILADPFFVQAVAVNNCKVQFTGHSFGAALAELVALKWRLTNGYRQCKVTKFGSPMVGTRRYVDRLRERFHHESVYFHTDPIFMFPAWSWSSTMIVGGNRLVQAINFVPDPDTFHYDSAGENNAIPRSAYGGEFMSQVNRLSQPMDGSNPWNFHFLSAYRHMMMLRAQNYPADVRDRFRYLEFNDDNSWGANWQPSASWRDNVNALASPAPPPFQASAGAEEDWGADFLSQFDFGGGQGAPNRQENLPAVPTQFRTVPGLHRRHR